MVKKICNKIFLFLRIKKDCRSAGLVIQFIRFGIVGFSNTIIYYLVYSGILLLFRKVDLFIEIDYIISQIAGFFVSVTWSYILNKRFVFLSKDNSDKWYKELTRAFISYGVTGLVVNTIIIILCVRIFNISEFIAPLIGLFVTVPTNFTLNKYWTFKN